MSTSTVNDYGRTIKARRTSSCCVCCQPIEKGSLITKMKNPAATERKKDRWVHPHCFNESPSIPAPSAPVNGTPVNGTPVSGEIDVHALGELRRRVTVLEQANEKTPDFTDELSVLSKLVDDMAATVEDMRPQVTEIHLPGAPEPKVLDGEHVHDRFEFICRLVQSGKNVFMPGPTGCGKTHLAQQVTNALDLDFAFISCSAGMSEGQLLGRLLPTGDGGQFEYVQSEFVRIYENGGLFLLDEIDAADENVLLCLNAALANGHCAIPNRPEKPVAQRHPDFRCMAAANTWGNGANAEYCGRNQQDMALLDRFVAGKVSLDYDEKLEARLCTSRELNTWLTSIRRAVRDNRIRRAVSTRTKCEFQSLLDTGFSIDECKRIFFEGWSRDEIAKVDSVYLSTL